MGGTRKKRQSPAAVYPADEKRVSYADDLNSMRGADNQNDEVAAILNSRRSVVSLTTDVGPSDSRSNTFSKSTLGYVSVFKRKLLPPLGFYREVEKYNNLKQKFEGDFDKLDSLEDMWQDFKKYQIRKRFQWPPKLFCNKFFWTTGYYEDYQKEHSATDI